MRRRPHRIACLLTAAVLALPAAAWGQSAGDDQYEDPFAPEPGQTDDGGGSSGGGGDVETAAPEPTQPAPAATEAQATPELQQQLPHTGADEGLVALAGGMLLAGGVALRLRLRS